MSQDSGHIFISYASQDRGLVSELASLLEGEGWPVWWDRENLPAGQRFHRVIDEAIKNAGCVMVCWSEASIESDWVIDEANEAKSLDKLMPVLLENVRPPYGFRSFHYVDLSQWDRKRSHQAFQRLVQELASQPLHGSRTENQSADDSSNDTRPTVIEDLSTLIDRLTAAELTPEDRLDAGDRLAEIGDPRPGVGVTDHGTPDIEWVDIPGGAFLSGEKKLPCQLSSFRMARYPVTNSQFQAFVDDDGYTDEAWWDELPAMEPSTGNSEWAAANRPRTFVSWYETIAYCRWLSYKHGFPISLPTERQWERAARGTGGFEYPWGDEYRSGYANVDELDDRHGSYQLNQPSTVGIYPLGISPEGILDLAGNVWEWMLNDHNNPQSCIETGNARRAVRGGAWNRNQSYARAVLRLGYLPYRRYGNLGFRVVC